MANEVELKLALAESDQSRFLRHPLLAAATSRQVETLDNIYYDTADLSLRRHGVALRLRRQGKRWLQTVKLAGKAAAGLTSRPEWETPYGGHFDFSPVDAVNVREWLQRPKLLARIAPVCETRFRRITWRFEIDGGTVLLTLDRGWIVANGQREAISELELELAGAPVSAIFGIAGQLAQRVGLAPSVFSKAERGSRLHAGTVSAPFKAVDPLLHSGMSPAAALRIIGISCLQHLQQNHPGALSSDDPEYIHQMRVATRRLRAALRLFSPVLPEAMTEKLAGKLATLTTELGIARDMDVLLSDIVNPVLDALPDEPRLLALASDITNQRHLARRHAVLALGAPPYGQQLLAALEFFETLHQHEQATAQTLSDFADDRLRTLRNKVRQLALAAKPGHPHDPRSLHALRIGLKRLRYALEFFTPLLEPRPTARLLERLTEMQDTLGQLNDLANAGGLLMNCAGEDARLREAVTLIGGWHGKRHHRLLKRVSARLDFLQRLSLPRLMQAK